MAVQVDGVKNAKVQSVFLEDLPIHHAAFAAGGNQVRFQRVEEKAQRGPSSLCARLCGQAASEERFLMVAAALQLVGSAFDQLQPKP